MYGYVDICVCNCACMYACVCMCAYVCVCVCVTYDTHLSFISSLSIYYLDGKVHILLCKNVKNHQ